MNQSSASRVRPKYAKCVVPAVSSFEFSVMKSPLRELFEVSVLASLARMHIFGNHHNMLDLSHLAIRPPELAFKALTATGVGASFKGSPRVVLTFFAPYRQMPASVTIETEIDQMVTAVEMVVPDQILGLDCLTGKSSYTGLFFNTCVGQTSSNLHDLLPAMSYAFEVGLKNAEALIQAHKSTEGAQRELTDRLLKSARDVEVLPQYLSPDVDGEMCLLGFADGPRKALERFGREVGVASLSSGDWCWWTQDFLVALRAMHLQNFGSQASADFPDAFNAQFEMASSPAQLCEVGSIPGGQ